MLEIEKFIKENPVQWRERLEQPPYNITINEDNDYLLLKYNMLESDFTQPLVKECRGLIIDKYTWKPVALSFKKFWNIQEPLHDEIDWRTACVQEKIDGSKILIWYNVHKNKWQVSTSGMLDAYKAGVNGFNKTYGQLFDEALEALKENIFYYMDPDCCYTFELVSPESRIVVPYKKTEIYFLGFRNKFTFEEFSPKDSALTDFIKTPKVYPLKSLEDCIKATEKMGFDEEGFVVVDKNWNRVKIKSPAYVQAHYLRSNNNMSYARILDMIEFGGDTADNFLKIYPEYKSYFDEVRNAKESFYNKVLKSLYDFDFIGSRKEAAEWINKKYKDISAFLFRYIDTNLYKLFVETEWNKLTKNKKLQYLGFKEEKDAEKFKEE